MDSFGTLSILPREILDKVYACGLVSGHNIAAYQRPNWLGADLAILTSSRSISEEATKVLYARGTFGFYADILTYWRILESWKDNHLIANITNVQLTYNFSSDGVDAETDWTRKWNATNHFASAGPGPVSLFHSPWILRNRFLITMKLGEWPSFAGELVLSPLFRATKDLSGFKVVILRLSAETPTYCPPVETTEDVVRRWTRAGQVHELYAGFEPLLHVIRETLQPALGVGNIAELQKGARQIEFRPRDFVATAKRREAVAVKAMSNSIWSFIRFGVPYHG